uniref:T-box domain-containing protein n=1 Tax=Caenorhabditis tropicalis TaxID=1561998 RepID=A0A1I7TLD6_9PELO
MDSFYTIEIKQEAVDTDAIEMEQDIKMDPFASVVIKQEPADTVAIEMEQDIQMDPFASVEIKQEPADTVAIEMKQDIKMEPFYTVEIKKEPVDSVAIKMEQDNKTLQNVEKNTTEMTEQKETNLINVKTESVDTFGIKIEPVDTFGIEIEPMNTVKVEEPTNTFDIENKPMERVTIQEEPIVTVAVSNPSQWETTGMKSVTATTQRSRPKPQFGFVVSGLCPQEQYRFFMKIELVDCFKYKYRADLGMFCRQSIEETTPEHMKPAYIEHHLELMPGSFWTSYPIVFSELILSTAKKCKSDTIQVLTRRAYQASLVIKNADGSIVKEFCDPLHSFVIVSHSHKNYEKETEKPRSPTKRPNEDTAGDGMPAHKMMKRETDNCE